MAALSFHETKNISCGEGGALLINDDRFVARAEIIREKGTNRSRFFRGEVDRYTWVDVGSSYLPSDLLAAVLLAQLEARDAIQQRRQAIWGRYRSELAEWAARIRRWSRTMKAIYVYFDNDDSAYAVDNALTLKRMLRQKKRAAA